MLCTVTNNGSRFFNNNLKTIGGVLCPKLLHDADKRVAYGNAKKKHVAQGFKIHAVHKNKQGKNYIYKIEKGEDVAPDYCKIRVALYFALSVR